MSSAATWAAIAAGTQKPVAQKPVAQKHVAQKPFAHTSHVLHAPVARNPPKNVCSGCQARYKDTNGGQTKPAAYWDQYDCICSNCTKCGALFYHVREEGFTDGGNCSCGNKAFSH